ncbi:M10 family metallopeptidase [Pseudomonas sp. 2FE]|uniref:M10 family metallopeptidase n=1 Tax=Pseudomonas sp. 2FE TaxID=2502190 RepID=UPI0010F5AC80|nr:M10 family metallopeptidase [Pseudomonas sp. 2FE]
MPAPNGSTTSSEVALSNNLHIDSLVYGSKWGGALGSSAALSYSFLSSSSYYATEYSFDNEHLNSYQLTSNQKAAVTQALGAWAAVANISFSLTTDSSTNVGDLRFGGYAGMDSDTAAWAYLPSGAPASGDVWIGPATSEANPTTGTYDYLTFVHEIGHALGLKHPFENGDSNSTVLPAEYDDVRYTVMSYTDPYSYEPTTPMLLDIAAIQYLYGANMQWHTGNDTYQWSAGKLVFETIWDAGGIDTLSASNQSQAVTLNLNPGTFSSIGATFWSGSAYINNGLAIAYGAQIENAVGSAYADTLIGNTLANMLNGGAGNDTLIGDLGNDTYVVDSASDVISETSTLASEIDTVHSSVSWTLGANLENLLLTGSLAINGTGNSLNNVIYANAGNNLLDGGAGLDSLSYAYAAAGVTVSLASTTAQATGGSASDTLLNFENLIGSKYNDTLTGSAITNVLNGGAGNDTLIGGLGNDTYVVDSASDVISETSTLATEIDTVHSSVSWTLGANLEKLVLNGSAAINGNGNALNNSLTGNTAANILNGGSGNDTLVGGLGNDTYIVDSSVDVISETSVLTSEIDSVWSSVNWTLGANFESLVLIGSAAINGTGNNLNNTLYASAGNNALDGGAGVDLLNYDLATTAVSVNLASTAAQATGGSGSDTLSNFENLTGSQYNDTLTGSTVANVLIGGTGNDTLSGGAGNDLLVGGAGVDRLNGGTGADRFDFNALTEMGLGSLRDVLGDFKSSEGDKIDLSTLDANTATAANDVFAFIGTSTFSSTNAAGQLRFAGSVLYGSTDTDAAAEFEIQLLGVTSLSNTDLLA